MQEGEEEEEGGSAQDALLSLSRPQWGSRATAGFQASSSKRSLKTLLGGAVRRTREELVFGFQLTVVVVLLMEF